MPKRCPKKVVKTTDVAQRLRKALAKRRKGELIDVLVELAKADRTVLRRLDVQFELEALPKELVAATRQAIADATDFDERDINRNFSYDYAAYGEVKRNLTRLVNLGQLGLAMELSLELMDQGSYQVEMSDEGLMAQDIEECFAVVMRALKKSDLPTRKDCVVRGDAPARPGGIHQRPATPGIANPLRGVAVVIHGAAPPAGIANYSINILGPSPVRRERFCTPAGRTQMILSLPLGSLVAADAGFVGYEYWKALLDAGHDFVIRVGANVKLLKNLGYARLHNDLVYLWPDAAAAKGQPPLNCDWLWFTTASIRSIW